jgi:kynureninase
VHNKHANNFEIPRLAGWWGNDEKTRFKMQKNFEPVSGAQSWQISNAPILSMAAHKASLEIFDKVSMKDLREKSILLTAYLFFLIKNINKKNNALTIITPDQTSQRGCQLSLRTDARGKAIFNELTKKGIIADWREPDVIRIAPVPLYNSFEDVYRFAEILEKAIK